MSQALHELTSPAALVALTGRGLSPPRPSGPK